MGYELNNDDKLALVSLEKQAVKGSVEALYQIGLIYWDHEGRKNKKQAFDWWQKAAKQGHPEAQYMLGLCHSLYAKDLQIHQDMVAAAQYFGLAADQGHVEARYCLGECYLYGKGIEANPNHAVILLRKALDQGVRKAGVPLGFCYAEGKGVEKDMGEAVKLLVGVLKSGLDDDASKYLETYANQGFLEAQFALGCCLDEGIGFLRDMSRATNWWRKAVEQGHQEALARLLKHAEENDFFALYNFGLLLDEGLGVELDREEAARVWGKAAKLGSKEAFLRLQEISANESADSSSRYATYYYGLCLANGWMHPQDIKKAAELWWKAVGQGYNESFNTLKEYADEKDSTIAQYYYGCCLEKGIGTSLDIGKAIHVWRKAAEKKYGMAASALEKYARQGNAAAQNALGIYYARVKHDMETAFKWWSMAAQSGNMGAQFFLGRCYFDGKGTVVDFAQAVHCWIQASDQGHAEAKTWLGRCYWNGEGIYVNKELAVELWRQAVKLGSTKTLESLRTYAGEGFAEAKYTLGLLYADGKGVDQNMAHATKLWYEAGERGYSRSVDKLVEYAGREDMHAQYWLGRCYEKGIGKKQDMAQAVKLWRQAAMQHHVEALYHLGLCFADGRAGEQDMAQAVKLWRQAANQDFSEAQYRLGMCYAEGKGVEHDMKLAGEWLFRAVNGGKTDASKDLIRFSDQLDPPSQFALGKMFAEGRVVKGDMAEAVRWYQKSAQGGDLDAMYQLGLCYEQGRGVTRKDIQRALMWYQKAADQGHGKAKAKCRAL